MGSQVQQALRSLCSNTQWKYAVFWRLQHQTRMLLTWEGAHYSNIEHPERRITSDFQDGCYPSDPLGLAVAKMSCAVYSLGEGIVGRTAITGKHMWISADNYLVDPGSLFEYCDGLKTQFLAGIKTIAVVAVVPHGVLQLGSLDRIAEDTRMVHHVRNVFFSTLDSIAGSTSIVCDMECPSQSDVCPKSSISGIYSESFHNFCASIQEDESTFQLQTLLSQVKPDKHSTTYPIPGGNLDVKRTMIDRDQGSENLLMASGEFGDVQLHTQNQEFGSVIETKCVAQSGDLLKSAKDSCSENLLNESSSYNAPPADWMDYSYFHSEINLYEPYNAKKRAHSVPKRCSDQLPKDNVSEYMDTLDMSVRFCAGYELYEALGPAFRDQGTHHNWDMELTGGVSPRMPERMGNTSREHLLEAMVANINQNDSSDTKCEISCQKSVESLLTVEKTMEPCLSDVGTISSAGYSFEQDTLISINSSETYGVRSSKGISSTSSSKVSGLLHRPQECIKTPKKRARPGESCRPRPRDRQLIQDRIKELRELVPNGSKCSIDSLLERTIKHMLFMQSITKHADKLKRCTASKLLDKETCIPRSSCDEQGSSWAVEVGSSLKVCPIIVENMNMNGQMLVEMLCEDSSHFLLVAEAIRSLGLTILKGVTETSREKTWMRLVVEGDRSGSVHRMDVLWCLMKLVQPNANN